MILERGRPIRKLQPKLQLNQDYLQKKHHYFFAFLPKIAYMMYLRISFFDSNLNLTMSQD